MLTKHLRLACAIILLVVGLSGCGIGPPSSAQGPVQETGPKPTPTVVDDESLLLCIDKTQSEDDANLPAQDLKEALANSSVREVIVLNVGANGKGAWNAESRKFTLPAKAGDSFNETAQEQAEAEAKSKCNGRLKCEEKVKRVAKEAAEKTAAEVAGNAEADRGRVLDQILAAILEPAFKEPRYTDVNGMASRIAQMPSSHVIWFTDGQHIKTGTTLKPQKFLKKRVLLAVMPLVSETDDNYMSRFRLLTDLYNDATVKPVASLSVASIQDFLSRK